MFWSFHDIPVADQDMYSAGMYYVIKGSRAEERVGRRELFVFDFISYYDRFYFLENELNG